MSSDDLPQWALDKARQALTNPAVGRALDLLLAAGWHEDKAADLVRAALVEGRDPEATARQMIELRNAFGGRA